jgi:hypothetical protein
MKIFISYGALHDQVTALRLQALGAAHGLIVYVPPAYTRQGFAPIHDADAQAKLVEADVVLGVLGTGLTETCRQELDMGLSLKKNMIVMASPHLAKGLGAVFGSNLVLIDPHDPGASERAIVEHLKGVHTQQSAKNALVALGLLTAGLVLLGSANAD